MVINKHGKKKTAKRSQTRKRYKTAKGTNPQKVQNRKNIKKIGGTFMSTSWNKPVKFSGVYNSETLTQYAFLSSEICTHDATIFDKNFPIIIEVDGLGSSLFATSTKFYMRSFHVEESYPKIPLKNCIYITPPIWLGIDMIRNMHSYPNTFRRHISELVTKKYIQQLHTFISVLIKNNYKVYLEGMSLGGGICNLIHDSFKLSEVEVIVKYKKNVEINTIASIYISSFVTNNIKNYYYDNDVAWEKIVKYTQPPMQIIVFKRHDTESNDDKLNRLSFKKDLGKMVSITIITEILISLILVTIYKAIVLLKQLVCCFSRNVSIYKLFPRIKSLMTDNYQNITTKIEEIAKRQYGTEDQWRVHLKPSQYWYLKDYNIQKCKSRSELVVLLSLYDSGVQIKGKTIRKKNCNQRANCRW